MSLYSNLIAQWKFNNNLLDTKGNHEGSYSGGSGAESYAVGRDGSINGSLNLNSDDNAIHVDNDSRLHLEEFSVSFWMKPSVLNDYDTFVYYGDAAGSCG